MSHETPTPRDLYDATSTGWARQGPLSLSDFTGRPPTLALCEPLAGLRVLDLGCGEGYCARLLRKRGAREVIGVDISAQMIALAQAEEAREPLGIRYEVGQATSLAAFPEASFDLVLSMFMFNYLGIDDTRQALAEILRVLRPSGRLVLAVPHPSFPLLRPPEPPFYFDLANAGYFSARDQRHSGRIWKRDGSALDVQVVHKTVEDFFEALAAAGFTRMPIVRELRVTPEILAADPPFFGPLLDLPLHMAIAVRK
jgi:ubiquinone/menaquinone biosynthesis C-methylase UbiE